MSTFVSKYAKEHGLRKLDAKKPAIVCVNAQDVRKAKMKNAKDCAFACAIKRTMGADAAFVFRSTCHIQKGDTITRYQLPTSVQKEIVSFDRTGKMEPGNFQLSRVSRNKTRAVKRLREPGTHPHGTRKRTGAVSLRHTTANVRGLLEPQGQPPPDILSTPGPRADLPSA